MKYLLVSNMFPSNNYPSYGVFVKNISENIKSFSNFENDFSVISGKPIGMFAKINKYCLFYLSTFLKALFFKYDFVYVHYISHSSLPILLVNIFKKQTIILNVHGGDVLKHDDVTNFTHYFKSLIAKWAINCSDLVIVPSSSYKDFILNNFPVSGTKVKVYASGGVDIDIFHPRSLYEKSTSLKIGYVGRFEPVKGVLTLLESAKLLKSDGIRFSLSLTGSGSLKDKLIAEIDTHNLHDYVSIQEQVDQSSLADLYRGFDCLVFPSHNESLGLVGIEAMSCGCPVLGADISGIRNYLIDEYNGLLFEEGNSLDLKTKIINFMSRNNEELSRMSLSCIETATKYERGLQTLELLKHINACTRK